MSAGPHFNPAGAPHGKAWSGPHHAGDMPNLETDNWGVAHVSIVVAGATLSPGPSSIAGARLSSTATLTIMRRSLPATPGRASPVA